MCGTERASVTGVSLAEMLRHTSGPVYIPGADGYDAARLPWNRAVDPRPAVVIEAAGVGDVRVAVGVAGERGLPVAVQATGHGAGPADGAVLVTTSRMNAVRVDPVRRVAQVSAGATWNEVIDEAGRYDLAPLSGSSPTVGVAGYTLGGGHAWLSRTYGFAADSLVRAEIITADGRLRTASSDDDPDLHWALRGGGGNFGVVTSLEVRLFPLARVYGGTVLFDSSAGMLARYRDWTAHQPDEMNTTLVMMSIPNVSGMPETIRGKRVLALRVCYAGRADDAERLLAPLRDAAGTPLMGELSETSYPHLARILADPPPPPQANRGHLEMFRELADPAIDALIDAAGQPAETMGSPVKVIEIRHFGGVVARPGPDAGPVGGREASLCVLASAPLDGLDPPETNRAHRYMDALAGRLTPHATGGAFLSFLPDPANIATAYAPDDYRRLRALKTVYDPDNQFGHPNIPPAR